jgi:hypothetical protein
MNKVNIPASFEHKAYHAAASAAKDAEKSPETPQTLSHAYKLAFQDSEFLLTDEMRSCGCNWSLRNLKSFSNGIELNRPLSCLVVPGYLTRMWLKSAWKKFNLDWKNLPMMNRLRKNWDGPAFA